MNWNQTKICWKSLLLAGIFVFPAQAWAHPHVFVEANIEVVRNDKGEFTEIRHVWRFDELFSATISIDYDNNANGELDPDELQEISDTVKESIAEYDFYTAARSGGKHLKFYEPEEINTYYEDGKMIMLLALELEKPLSAKEGIRVSASDSSYYVAFDFDKENVIVAGNTKSCNTEIEHPDFDALYADNADTLTEAFFEDPNSAISMGDEFYSWATINCG